MRFFFYEFPSRLKKWFYSRSPLFLLILAFIFLPLKTYGVEVPVSARVTKIQGSVEFALPESDDYQRVRRNMVLPMGSKIRTAKDAEVFLLIPPGSAVRVGENTEMTLSEMALRMEGANVEMRKTIINLKSGTVTGLINKDMPPEKTDFRIVTPQGTSAARGTFFAVTVDGDESFLKVEEGIVDVIPIDVIPE
jgi:hypothetical protein